MNRNKLPFAVINRNVCCLQTLQVIPLTVTEYHACCWTPQQHWITTITALFVIVCVVHVHHIGSCS